MRVDCHVHTQASWDCLLNYRDFVADAVANRIDAVIVCDHNTLAGVEALQKMNPPFRVIPGAEITTSEGELLGFFIREVVPLRCSPEEAIKRLHDQGALAVLPHPFVRTALNRLRPRALERLADLVDAVEGANGRNNRPAADEISHEWAARHGKPLTAGSDAHLPGWVGMTHIEIEDFTDAADFLAKLPAARLVVIRRASVWASTYGFVRALAHLAVDRIRGPRQSTEERDGR